jgi:hypothetical protein
MRTEPAPPPEPPRLPLAESADQIADLAERLGARAAMLRAARHLRTAPVVQRARDEAESARRAAHISARTALLELAGELGRLTLDEIRAELLRAFDRLERLS